jgi:hypothetical protein
MKYVLYFYILLKSIIWCTYFCMLRSILGIHDECFNYPSPNKQQYKYDECFNYPSPNKQQYKYKCTKSKTQTRSVTDICCWYHHYGMEIITSILFVDITTTVWRLLPVSCLLISPLRYGDYYQYLVCWYHHYGMEIITSILFVASKRDY